MVRHIVWWTLKPEAEGRTAAENAKLIKQRLEALMGQIPSLKSLEVSYDFLPTCTMPVNVILMTTHDDAEGLKAYAEHPAHVAVGKELIKLADRVPPGHRLYFLNCTGGGKGAFRGNALRFLSSLSSKSLLIRPQPATPLLSYRIPFMTQPEKTTPIRRVPISSRGSAAGLSRRTGTARGQLPIQRRRAVARGLCGKPYNRCYHTVYRSWNRVRRCWPCLFVT